VGLIGVSLVAIVLAQRMPREMPEEVTTQPAAASAD
jgi:hypothetical protein